MYIVVEFRNEGCHSHFSLHVALQALLLSQSPIIVIPHTGNAHSDIRYQIAEISCVFYSLSPKDYVQIPLL